MSSEVVLKSDTFIVSRADSKGRVLYANQEFLTISGYSEMEVIGSHHNFIRHPDMPKAIFKLLWDTIKSGTEFNGYVKNSCKNGDYYWVFATITTSITNDGDTIYYSVRKKPSETAINTIKPLYAEMLEAETNDSVDTSTAILNDNYEPFEMSYDQYVLSL